jgi:predicted DNA-binding transcriptional regulator YafY
MQRDRMKTHDTIATRLAQILNKLNSGEHFSVEELVLEFNVTKRTIQRDLSERLSYLPIKKENGLYFLEEYYLGKLNFKDIKNFAMLSGIKELYPSLGESFLKDILDNTVSKAYLIKGHNYEDISNLADEFKLIENAILNHTKITFIYKDKKRAVEPYRLVNTKGIWYLAGVDAEILKTFAFKKISKLKTSSDIFTPQEDILSTIKNDDNVWFSSNQTEVILNVDKEVSSYFKREKSSLIRQLSKNLVMVVFWFQQKSLMMKRY